MSVVTLCAGEPGRPVSPSRGDVAPGRAEIVEPDEVDVLDKVPEGELGSAVGAGSSEDAQAPMREQGQEVSLDPPKAEIDTVALKDKVSESLDVAAEKMDRLKIMAKKAVGLEETLNPEVSLNTNTADSTGSSSVISESTGESRVEPFGQMDRGMS